MSDEKRRRAIHEAAHAVLGIARGCHLVEVSINETPEGYGGYAEFGGASTTPARDKCIVTLAGHVAEEIAFGGSEYRGSQDEADIAGFGVPGVPRLRAKVRRWLEKNWQDVEEVAAALVESPSGTVTRREVMRLIG